MMQEVPKFQNCSSGKEHVYTCAFQHFKGDGGCGLFAFLDQ